MYSGKRESYIFVDIINQMGKVRSIERCHKRRYHRVMKAVFYPEAVATSFRKLVLNGEHGQLSSPIEYSLRFRT